MVGEECNHRNQLGTYHNRQAGDDGGLYQDSHSRGWKKWYNFKHILEVHHLGFVDEYELESERGEKQSVSSREEEKFGDRNVSSISHVKYDTPWRQTNGVA